LGGKKGAVPLRIPVLPGWLRQHKREVDVFGKRPLRPKVYKKTGPRPKRKGEKILFFKKEGTQARRSFLVQKGSAFFGEANLKGKALWKTETEVCRGGKGVF